MRSEIALGKAGGGAETSVYTNIVDTGSRRRFCVSTICAISHVAFVVGSPLCLSGTRVFLQEQKASTLGFADRIDVDKRELFSSRSIWKSISNHASILVFTISSLLDHTIQHS